MKIRNELANLQPTLNKGESVQVTIFVTAEDLMTQFPHDLKKQNEIKYIKYWNYYDKYAWKRFLYKKKLI